MSFAKVKQVHDENKSLSICNSIECSSETETHLLLIYAISVSNVISLLFVEKQVVHSIAFISDYEGLYNFSNLGVTNYIIINPLYSRSKQYVNKKYFNSDRLCLIYVVI